MRPFPAIETLEPRQLFNGGELDTSFGNGGVLPMSHGAQITQVFNLPDGRLVATGTQDNAVYFRRFTQSGEIDPTFTDNAIVPGVRSRVASLPAYAVDSSERLLVGGLSKDETAAVVRVTADGSIDSTFHVDQMPLQSINSIHVPSDGSILVSGVTSQTTDDDGNPVFHLGIVKLKNDGALDTTFGTNGVASIGSYTNAADEFFSSTHTIAAEQIFQRSDGSLVYLRRVEQIGTFYDDNTGTVTGHEHSALMEAFSFTAGGASDSGFTFNTDLGAQNGDAWLLPSATLNGDGSVQFEFLRRIAPSGNAQFSLYTARLGTDGAVARIRPIAHGVVVPENPLGVKQVDGSYLFDTTNQTFTRYLPNDGGADPSWTPTANGFMKIKVGAINLTDDGQILVGYNRRAGNFTSTFFAKLERNDSPTGIFAGKLDPKLHSQSYYFNVTWHDDDEVDASSIGQYNLNVVDPRGQTESIELVSRSLDVNDTVISARYRIISLVGTWDDALAGEYRIRIRPGSVLDVNGHAAEARTIGRFFVKKSVT